MVSIIYIASGCRITTVWSKCINGPRAPAFYTLASVQANLKGAWFGNTALTNDFRQSKREGSRNLKCFGSVANTCTHRKQCGNIALCLFNPSMKIKVCNSYSVKTLELDLSHRFKCTKCTVTSLSASPLDTYKH